MPRIWITRLALLAVLAGAGPMRAQSILTFAGGGSADGNARSVSIVPAGIAIATNGDIVVADAFNNRIRRIAANGTVTTIAGNGAAGGFGDGGPAVQAQLGVPVAVAHDSSGNLYVAEQSSHRVRKVAVSGVIATFAGSANGVRGVSGDGGLAADARLDSPAGVAVDGAGNVYIADGGNHRIRRVDANGVITTIAGTGAPGFSGDGGAATAASLNSPATLVIDHNGGLLVADVRNNRVRRIDLSSGVITTVAGNGGISPTDGVSATSSGLDFTTFFGGTGFVPGLAADAIGAIYIGDFGNKRVRRVVNQMISTVAGNGEFCCTEEGALATATPISFPSGLAVDAGRNLVVGSCGANQVYRIDRASGRIFLLAGNTSIEFISDGLPATATALSQPSALAFDAAGNVYLSDIFNDRVRRVSIATGIVATVAGSGDRSGSTFSGDGGPATAARFWQPDGVAIDTNGTMYIGDAANNRIRRVDPDGTVTTIAGNGLAGNSGDGGPAVNASLNMASFGTARVALDGRGHLYIVDAGNHRVRRIDLLSGVLTAFAGNGAAGFSGDGGTATAAALNTPWGIACDLAGNVYIADSGNSRVRRVDASTGVVSTVAGNGLFAFGGDGGPATQGSFNRPAGVRVAANGDLYVADFLNGRIRKVGSDGRVTTVAGGPAPGNYAGDGGAATAASLDLPTDVAIDAAGNVYIADSRSKRVRVVYACTPLASLSLAEPADGTAVESVPGLVWNALVGAFSYDVFFSTSNPPLARLASLAPTTITPFVIPAGSRLATTPPSVTPGARYYWQVAASGDPFCAPVATALSPVRSFSVSSLSADFTLGGTIPGGSGYQSKVGATITFTPVETAGDAVYTWNFGDGLFASTRVATHKYATAGTYAITLTIRYVSGAMRTASRQIAIQQTTPRHRAVRHPGPAVQLVISPSAVNVEATAGREAPAAVSVTISSPTGAVQWSARSIPSWASITPSAGTTPTTVRIAFDTRGLGAMKHEAALEISGTNTSGSLGMSLTLASPPAPWFQGSASFGVHSAEASVLTLSDGASILAPSEVLLLLSRQASTAEQLSLERFLDSARARVIGEIPTLHALQVAVPAGSVVSMIELLKKEPGIVDAIPNPSMIHGCLLGDEGTRGDHWIDADNLVPAKTGEGDCASAKTVVLILDCFDRGKCPSQRGKNDYSHGEVVEAFAQRAAGGDKSICIQRAPTDSFQNRIPEDPDNWQSYAEDDFGVLGDALRPIIADPSKRVLVNWSSMIGVPAGKDAEKTFVEDAEVKAAVANALLQLFGRRVALITSAEQDQKYASGSKTIDVAHAVPCNLVNISSLDRSSSDWTVRNLSAIDGTSVRAFAPGCGINPNPETFSNSAFTGTSYAAPQWTGQLAALSTLHPEKDLCEIISAIDTLKPDDLRRLDGRKLNDALKSSSAIVVRIRDSAKTLPRGGKWTFTATVTGTGNTAVTWEASAGTITANGVYTAPESDGLYEVRARSVADPNVFDRASIIVVGKAGLAVGTLPSFSIVKPQSQTKSFTISNTGEFDLIWSAKPSQSWITLSRGSGTVSKGSSITIDVTVNSSSLSPGPASAIITITDPEASPKEATVTVSVTVTQPPAPKIVLDRSSVSFTIPAGQSSTQTVNLSNAGDAALSFVISDNGTSWLDETPGTGSLPPGQSAAIAIKVDASSLATGNHSAVVTVKAEDNSTSPVSLNVNVTVTSSGPQKYNVTVKGTASTRYQLTATSTPYIDQMTVDLVFRNVQFYPGKKDGTCFFLTPEFGWQDAGTITGSVSATETPAVSQPINQAVNITSNVRALLDSPGNMATVENRLGALKIRVLLSGGSSPASLNTVEYLTLTSGDNFHYFRRGTSCAGFTQLSGSITVSVSPVP